MSSLSAVRMWILDRKLKMSPHRMLLADCTALEAMPKIALTHPRILASSTWPIWQNNHYCSQLPIEWKLPIWGSLAATLLERHSRMIMKLASNLHKSLHRPHSSFQFFSLLLNSFHFILELILEVAPSQFGELYLLGMDMQLCLCIYLCMLFIIVYIFYLSIS
jgi:hypothetical protein